MISSRRPPSFIPTTPFSTPAVAIAALVGAPLLSVTPQSAAAHVAAQVAGWARYPEALNLLKRPDLAPRADLRNSFNDYVSQSGQTTAGIDVIASGGRVEIVPTVKGFSTTNIVKKLTANSMQSEDIQK